MNDSVPPEDADSAQDDAEHGAVDGETFGLEPELQPGDDEDWSVAQHHIGLMRRLQAAITAHIEAGELVPSLELETALEAVRGELGWH